MSIHANSQTKVTTFWELLTTTYADEVAVCHTLRELESGQVRQVEDVEFKAKFFPAVEHPDHFSVPVWGNLKFDKPSKD